ALDSASPSAHPRVLFVASVTVAWPVPLAPDRQISPNLRSTLVRLGSAFWKERNVRKQLLESRFPHHSCIRANFVWTNRAPSAIDEPASVKVGEANSIAIEHAKTDAGGPASRRNR